MRNTLLSISFIFLFKFSAYSQCNVQSGVVNPTEKICMAQFEKIYEKFGTSGSVRDVHIQLLMLIVKNHPDATVHALWIKSFGTMVDFPVVYPRDIVVTFEDSSKNIDLFARTISNIDGLSNSLEGIESHFILSDSDWEKLKS